MTNLPFADDVRAVYSETFTQDLTVAALNATTTVGREWKLNYITINRVGTGGNQVIEIMKDAAAGANYDAVFDSETLANNDSIVVIFNPGLYFADGDELNITFPSLGGAGRDIYIEVIGEYV